jgi:hypothetical protein
MSSGRVPLAGACACVRSVELGEGTVRAAAAYLRAVLPLDKSVIRNRLTRIKNDLDAYRLLEQAFEDRLLKLADTMKGLLWADASPFVERSKKSDAKMFEALRSVQSEIKSLANIVQTIVEQPRLSATIFAHLDGESVSLLTAETDEEPS